MNLEYSDYVWDRGAFRQKDLAVSVNYDAAYLSYYGAMDDQVRKLARKRVEVLGTFVPRGRLLDYGCGTGRVVQAAIAAGWDALGYDVGVSIPAGKWDVVTFFDSLEHLTEPDGVIRFLGLPRWLMVSVPECHHPESPSWFMSWKHRKPGEHLWHFSRAGLQQFLREIGYKAIMLSNFEDDFRAPYDPPQDNILTGIFRRV